MGHALLKALWYFLGKRWATDKKVMMLGQYVPSVAIKMVAAPSTSISLMFLLWPSGPVGNRQVSDVNYDISRLHFENRFGDLLFPEKSSPCQNLLSPSASDQSHLKAS